MSQAKNLDDWQEISDEMDDWQEVKPEEPSFLQQAGEMGLSALETAGKIADIPGAAVRGTVGNITGTENQGLTPWTGAPSSKEIVESVAPSMSEKIDMRSKLPADLQMDPKVRQMMGIPEEISKSELVAPFIDVASGLGIAKAGGKIASSIAKPAAKYLDNLANEKAVKAAGAMKPEMDRLGPEGVQKLGSSLLEEKMVTPLSRPKTVLARVESKIDELMTDIGERIKQADDVMANEMNMENATTAQIQASKKAQIKTSDLKEEIKAGIRKDFEGVPLEELAPALSRVEVWFSNRPEYMKASEFQKIKTGLNSFIRKADFNKDLVGMNKEGLMAVRRGSKEAIEKQTDAVAEILGDAGGQIKNTNRRLGNMLEAQDMATDRVARDAANRSFSLTDYGVGGAGAMAGSTMFGVPGLIMGPALAGANKLGRMYGNPLMATGFKSTAGGLDALERAIPSLQKGQFAGSLATNSPALAPMIQEPKLDGVPIRMTAPVPPEQMEVVRTEIQRNPVMGTTERAKRLNMLNKHGRAY